MLKYEDLDTDGSRDPGEPLLGTWSFNVCVDGRVVATVITASSGTASVSLPAGVYAVTELARDGWYLTDPRGKEPTKLVTVRTGSPAIVEFGGVRLPIGRIGWPVIGAIVFEDADRDGVRAPNERGLAGWTVLVRDATGESVCVLETDARLLVVTPDLKPGVYTVTLTVRAGWSRTGPSGMPVETVAVELEPRIVAFGVAPMLRPRVGPRIQLDPSLPTGEPAEGLEYLLVAQPAVQSVTAGGAALSVPAGPAYEFRSPGGGIARVDENNVIVGYGPKGEPIFR